MSITQRLRQIKDEFKKYKKLAKAGKYKQADVIGGRIYGYPACCVREFIKERDPKYIAKNYSYGKYFKRLQDIETKFPFLVHTPCATSCKRAEALNKKYREAINKMAPKFYKEFTRKQKFTMPIIINFENDLMINGKTIWPVRKMHNYTAITRKPIIVMPKSLTTFQNLSRCGFAAMPAATNVIAPASRIEKRLAMKSRNEPAAPS